MATSSITENILINDKKAAEALIEAIEASQVTISDVVCKNPRKPPVEAKIATKKDIRRLHKIRMSSRNRNS